MKSKIFFILYLLFSSLACQKVEEPAELYQYSSINTLMDGNYDGEMTFDRLKTKGDFGIGTFNGLDGEMIALNGSFYQIKSDGQVYPVDGIMKTPFATMCHFKSDTSLISQNKDYENFISELDSYLISPNIFYAIRAEGEFSYLKTRSVAKQSKPYLPLIEVVNQQSTFSFENVKGTLVGFRVPEYLNEVNVPGYHFHFISEDRTEGGHVLGLKANQLKIEIDFIHSINLDLPRNEAFYEMKTRLNLQSELEKVEK